MRCLNLIRALWTRLWSDQQGVITIFQELSVQPQSLGEVFIASNVLAGPASYTGGAGNGQVISATMFGLLSIKFVVAEDMDNTETYYVRVIQSQLGATKTFRARWYVIATNAEVANATNLSASRVRYEVIGN